MQKTKDGRIGMHTRISPELKKALKIRATREDRDLWELVEDAIKKYLKEESK